MELVQLVPPVGSERITPGVVEQNPRTPLCAGLAGTAVARKKLIGLPLVWSTPNRYPFFSQGWLEQPSTKSSKPAWSELTGVPEGAGPSLAMSSAKPTSG